MAEREPISNVPIWMWPIIAVSLCAGAGMIGAFYVVLIQCTNWLKIGEWHPLPADWAWAAVGLQLPVTRMVGAERIVEWLVWIASPAPLAVTALIVGFLPVAILFIAWNWLQALASDVANYRVKKAERKSRL